jgi:hypothetical protein
MYMKVAQSSIEGNGSKQKEQKMEGCFGTSDR